MKKITSLLNIRNSLILTVLFFITLVWLQAVFVLVIMLILSVLTVVTVHISKKIPHITFDAYAASYICITYYFGVLMGFAYIIGIGVLTALVNGVRIPTVLMRLGTGFVIISIMTFVMQYFNHISILYIAIVIRTLVAFPLYMWTGSSMYQSLTNQLSLLIVTLVLYLPLFVNIISIVF